MNRLGLTIVVVIMLSLVLCGVTKAQSRFYWIDYYDQEIHWSYTDGSKPSTANQLNPVNATVDQARGWIYWLTENMGHGVYGKMYRAPLHDPSQEIKIADTGYSEGGLEVDSKTGFVYWSAPWEYAQSYSIARISPESPSVAPWLLDAGQEFGRMDIDSEARLLFFTNDQGLVRAHLDSGNTEEVELDWSVLPAPSRGWGIALDTLHRKVYWSDRGPDFHNLEGNTTRIYRAQYMGGQPTLVHEAENARVTEMVFDPVSRALYWAETSLQDGSSVQVIKKMVVGEALPTDGTEVFTVSEDPVGLSLFADTGPASLVAPKESHPSETTVELSWTSVLGSPRYDVVVASDPEFRSVVYEENTPNTFSEFVAPVAGRPYYWRVQSNSCFIAPHWSAWRTLDVGDSGPLAARLIHPESGAVIEPSATFEWDAAPDASSYTFEIAESPSFSPVLIGATSLTETSRLVSDLNRGAELYWRVAGVDEGGRYTYTSPGTFSIAELLGAVSLTKPSDGADGVAPYTQLEWLVLDRADAYEIQISELDDMSNPVVSVSSEEATILLEAPLSYSRTYYWRVRAVNDSGPGDWSDVWSFTVAVGTSNEAESDIPVSTRLLQPYPNPAAGLISIPFELAAAANVTFDVYDVSGRLVTSTPRGETSAGRYTMRVDVTGLHAGAYFVVMNGDLAARRTVLIVK